MKKYLVLIMLLFAVNAWSADTKVSDLGALTPDGADMLYCVDDVSGTPTSKSCLVSATLIDANIPNDITIDLATTVTTNANLTGHVTSTGNAAILGSFTEAQLETAVSDDNPVFDGDIGSSVQAWDAELDTIAALTETNGNVMFVAGGVWTSDATPAIVGTDFTGTASGLTAGNATETASNADWTIHDSYPAACNAGEYVNTIGDTSTCVDATTEINSVVNGLGGTNLTCSSQNCDVDDAFIKLGGDVATAGTYDFGGASVILEIPNDAAVTDPAVAGQVAIDLSSDQFLYYGGAQRVTTYRYTTCRTLETPIDADDNIPVWAFPEARTITDVHCLTEGGTSIDLTICDDSANCLEAITCDADGADDDGSIANATFLANENIEWNFSALSGSVDWIKACITLTVDPD